MTTPPTDDDDDEFVSAVDEDALKRCIETMRASKTPGEQQQIERMLAEDDWWDVAAFAAFSCQMDALHLKPWQPPPCWVEDPVAVINAGNDGVGGQYAAARLLRRMLDAGLSRYEPDPLGALERTKPPRAA